MSLVPYARNRATIFQWTTNAAIELIRQRRTNHAQFDQPHSNHDNLWTTVSNGLFAAAGFVATPGQCRRKWNDLKRGYENLQRILSNNPQGYPLRSPNSFDHACYVEMSDEFWTRTSNYLFQI